VNAHGYGFRHGIDGVRLLSAKPNLDHVVFVLHQETYLSMKDLLEAGQIAPVIDRRYPLADVAGAINYLCAGKVVINVS
jgi:NADPH:quinone reductase-like Zn-dependent oxidoreductase